MNARLLFFWDYDTEWGAERSRAGHGPASWGPLEFPHTEELLELHARYSVPACFAVVGAAALPGRRPRHDPAQIRRIRAAGHEVASHGFRHEWLPALGARELLTVLQASRDALEQCLGEPVTTFVPPYNQPFDCLRRGSVSLSERIEAGRCRTDLAGLCAALNETGFRFCRVAYRPVVQRVKEMLLRRRDDQPSREEILNGITCVRLNTPGGFGPAAAEMLRRVAADGGMAVVYGHPHSIHSGNSQDVSLLEPFLAEVAEYVRSRRLVCCLPGQLRNFRERAA